MLLIRRGLLIGSLATTCALGLACGRAPAEAADYARINAPVLGLYGGDDERVNSTIQRAEEAMAAGGKSFEPIIFEGAGHGFLRAQEAREGANTRAAAQAWPRTVEFFREHLGN